MRMTIVTTQIVHSSLRIHMLDMSASDTHLPYTLLMLLSLLCPIHQDLLRLLRHLVASNESASRMPYHPPVIMTLIVTDSSSYLSNKRLTETWYGPAKSRMTPLE